MQGHQVAGELRLNLLAHGLSHVLRFALHMKATKNQTSKYLSPPNQTHHPVLKSSCHCYCTTKQGLPHPTIEGVRPLGKRSSERWKEPSHTEGTSPRALPSQVTEPGRVLFSFHNITNCCSPASLQPSLCAKLWLPSSPSLGAKPQTLLS